MSAGPKAGLLAIVLQRSAPRFDMVGQRLPDTLQETTETISSGLVQRLRRYALQTLEDAGFSVTHWSCEVYTMDAEESPADRVYTVEFVNPKGGMLGVQGIMTRHGWPSLDHGLCVGANYPSFDSTTAKGATS